MKIAVFHNYYAQRGGEDVMFELECEALRSAGHEVVTYTLHNGEILGKASAVGKALHAWRAVSNPVSRRAVLAFLREHRPDVSHVHNWFPVLSPSVYHAHEEMGIPVVQTLHNYRMGCASGNYRRNGSACEACSPLDSAAAVRHRCYRGSLVGSLAWKRTMDRNWADGTFVRKVARYIAPSNLVARQHEKMGLDSERISVVPNACEDPLPEGFFPPAAERRGVVFLGRLVPEKGAEVLLRAWKEIQDLETAGPHELLLIGEGPEEAYLKQKFGQCSNTHFLGQLTRAEVQAVLRHAAVLVFPSIWPEPFGLGIIEAMAAGCPVICSRAGAPAEIVRDGVDGLLVNPGDPGALKDALISLLSDRERMGGIGGMARQSFERAYTPAAHAGELVRVFESVLKESVHA